MILFINACVRKKSRTVILAEKLLAKLNRQYVEVRLEDIKLPAVDEMFLSVRDEIISERNYNDPTFALARQFAEADSVIIAAPFWDLSFPAALKQYFEQINVIGITFRYTPEGIPQGLCRAKELIYVTTAGGDYFPEEFGFGYIKSLAQNFYGIKDVSLLKATGLDIVGADVNAILDSAFDDYCRNNKL